MPPSAAHAATASRARGRPEVAGQLDRRERLGVDREQVGGSDLLGDVDRGQLEQRAAPGPQGRDRGPRPGERAAGQARSPPGPPEGGAEPRGSRAGRRGPRRRRRSAPTARRGRARGPRRRAGRRAPGRRGGAARRRGRHGRAGGTRRPSTPSRTWAAKVPTALASTGSPCCRASRTFCEAVADAVGQGEDVVAGEERRRPGRPGRSRRAPRPGSPRRGSAASSRTRRPASPHSSPATVSRTPSTSRRASRRRSTPLYSRTMPSASSRVGPSCSGRGSGGPPGQVRRQVELADPGGAERRGGPGLLVGVHEDGVGAPEQRRDELPVARGAARAGRTLWATTTTRGPPRPPAPAARSRARWAGTTAGTTWTRTTTSTSRSRRPARTHVSGRAHESTRRVRGKGGTSGAPPGTACSPG